MIDYEYKAKCLNDTLFVEYNAYSLKRYKLMFKSASDWSTEDDILAKQCEDFFNSLSIKQYKEFERLSHARCQRVNRLKKRISYMVGLSPCVFLTLTFTDLILDSTSELQRKRFVRDYLHSFRCLYIANQDFGKTYGREHYHAIIGCERVDYSLWNKKFGSVNGLKVGYSSKDFEKLGKYIAKLTNHAIKVTNKRSVIMYSKGFPKDL